MLKELWNRTPEEKLAQTTVKRLESLDSLKPRQISQLQSARTLSRRVFIRRGATIAGGMAAFLGTPAGIYLLSHQESGQTPEDRFFADITRLPTREQVEKVDDFYSKNRLSITTARERVVPIWVKDYMENSGTDKTAEELLQHIILFDKPQNPQQAKITTGNVSQDSRTGYKGTVEINFNTFPSNRLMPSNDGQTVPGIVFQRVEMMHELSHWDVTFRDSPTLGKIINDFKVYDPSIDFADRIQLTGFSFVTIEPDQTAHTFFFNLDELATDTTMSYIVDKGKHRRVFGYSNAWALRDFIDWIGLPGDRFVQYHRNSDLEGVAKAIGELSNKNTNSQPKSEQETTAKGLKVLKAFHLGQPSDLNALDTFFPGTSQRYSVTKS